MQARFKLRTGGPRSLTVRGIRYEADRIYTTTKPGMVAFLKSRPEFTFLSIEGEEDDKPEPAPKKSAPKRGGPITSADLKTFVAKPADEPDPDPEPEPKKKPAKKKTKKRTTKKRTRKK